MDALLVPIHRNEAGRAMGGISRRQVYRLIQRGELTKVQIGTRTFVTAESIRAYVDRLTETSA
jgi:hypothetical protein